MSWPRRQPCEARPLLLPRCPHCLTAMPCARPVQINARRRRSSSRSCRSEPWPCAHAHRALAMRTEPWPCARITNCCAWRSHTRTYIPGLTPAGRFCNCRAKASSRSSGPAAVLPETFRHTEVWPRIPLTESSRNSASWKMYVWDRAHATRCFATILKLTFANTLPWRCPLLVPAPHWRAHFAHACAEQHRVKTEQKEE